MRYEKKRRFLPAFQNTCHCKNMRSLLRLPINYVRVLWIPVAGLIAVGGTSSRAAQQLEIWRDSCCCWPLSKTDSASSHCYSIAWEVTARPGPTYTTWIIIKKKDKTVFLTPKFHGVAIWWSVRSGFYSLQQSRVDSVGTAPWPALFRICPELQKTAT